MQNSMESLEKLVLLCIWLWLRPPQSTVIVEVELLHFIDMSN